MRHTSTALAAILFLGPVSARADFLSYREHLFQPLAPIADKESQAGFDNPAIPGTTEGSSLELAVPLTERGEAATAGFGLFARMGGLGFGMVQHRSAGQKPIHDYRVSLGFGDSDFAFGLGTGWTTGHPPEGRKDHWKAAAVWRPSRFLSLSALRTATYSGSAGETVGELGVRPLGSDRLTLFGDWSEGRQGKIPENWSAGGILRVGEWANLFARYAWNSQASYVTAGLGLGIGSEIRLFGGRTRLDEGSTRQLPLVLSARMRSHPEADVPAFRPVYAKLTLSQSPVERLPTGFNRFFSGNENRTLLSLLASLEEVRTSSLYKGVLVEIRGPVADLEKAWEIRKKLLDIKARGKRVVAYLETTGMSEYLIASTADSIVMAPYTDVQLSGFARARTYAKRTLDKLGLGVQEFRFLKYKSAAETLSRTSMSEGEKEQSQRIVDAFLASWTTEVTTSRPQVAARIREIIDSPRLVGPETAKELGLADAIGTREQVEDVVTRLEGRKATLRDLPQPANLRTEDVWGPRPRIAVVYAVGSCAMDSGIQARRLATEIDTLSEDDNVKALVLRVNSPGGDALAADVVNQALGRFRSERGPTVPIVVSQGGFAASGGYWLGLDSDAIFSSPYTITGSIGVIGAWVYDAGASNLLGLDPTVVKAGKYADRASGVSLPLLGDFLPQRMLAKEEEEAVVESMKKLYGDFLEKVSRFRKKPREAIEKVAEGRVWTGADALENGLVDSIGGFDAAITDAIRRAGLNRDRVEVIETPHVDLWDREEWGARIGARNTTRELAQSLVPEAVRFRMERNGQPLAALPLELAPEKSPE